jgi:hypothetical protein
VSVRTTLPLHVPSHRSYSKGCRCDGCRAEHRTYERTRKRLRGRPDGPGPSFFYVPANEAQEHLLWLTERGVGIRQMSRVSGVSKSTLQRIRSGVIVTIRSTTSKRVLALNLYSVTSKRHPYHQPAYLGGK